MARNVEIKARLPAPSVARVTANALALATAPALDLQQDDSFYACAQGRLKLRRFADGTAELIAYQRQDLPGPKTSDYQRTTVARTPSRSCRRNTSSMGRPAVPPGSPSSLAAECPPAIRAQQTCDASGWRALSVATLAWAAGRSATGSTQAMKRLFLMISSAWTGLASVNGMARA